MGVHDDASQIGVDEALEELQAWRSARRAGEAGRDDGAGRLRSSLASELRRRPGAAGFGTKLFGADQYDTVLLQQVAELVTMERQCQATKASFQQAEREMCLDPQQTLHRII